MAFRHYLVFTALVCAVVALLCLPFNWGVSLMLASCGAIFVGIAQLNIHHD